MAAIRFLMIGGFLGAGKTTALARLATHYIQQGRRVGLVTNDQAHDLVDTHALRAQGFDVGEVPGACFCCKFEDLVETVAALGESARPEIVLAEPVGSCTDLVATVIEPLRLMYGDQYEVGPLAVLLKPEHGRRILREEGGVGFSPKAAYIFLKQIEEADVVAINKVDKLSVADQQELVALVAARFPNKEIQLLSLREGEGWQDFVRALEAPRAASRAPLPIDYDVYAEGEAEMGWLNCSAVLRRASEGMLLQDVAERLVVGIQKGLADNQLEPIHLKVMASGGDGWSVANLVSSDDEVEASRLSSTSANRCELIVNARVAADPAMLAELVEAAINRLAEDLSAECRISEVQHFRPGRPVPTHRIQDEV